MTTKTTILAGLSALFLAAAGYLAYEVHRSSDPVATARAPSVATAVPHGIAPPTAEPPPGVDIIVPVTPPLPTMPPSVPEHPDETSPPPLPPELAAALEQRAQR